MSGGLYPYHRKPRSRVWLPSQRALLHINPRRPLSAPNTPGLYPSKLSSKQVIRKEFPLPSPLLRSPAKPLKPRAGAPAACSHPLSRPPLRSPVFYAGSGASALLGLLTSQALPPLTHSKGLLHLLSSLSSLTLTSLSTSKPPDLRVSSISGLAISHRNGRRPVWPSSPTAASILLKP